MKSSGGEEPKCQRHPLGRAVVTRRAGQAPPERRALAHLAIAEQRLLGALEAVIVQRDHELGVTPTYRRERGIEDPAVNVDDVRPKICQQTAKSPDDERVGNGGMK